jgi:hypothetical protein
MPMENVSVLAEELRQRQPWQAHSPASSIGVRPRRMGPALEHGRRGKPHRASGSPQSRVARTGR